jgi:hypothetical protein
MHPQRACCFAQSSAGGREESAWQAASPELLKPGPPSFGAGAEVSENSRDLGRDPGLAAAEAPARVIDQEFDPFA